MIPDPPRDEQYWAAHPEGVAGWGWGTGHRYRDSGPPQPAGTRGVVRKISTARKERGLASDDYDRRHPTP
jgi:hypothetical protein